VRGGLRRKPVKARPPSNIDSAGATNGAPAFRTNNGYRVVTARSTMGSFVQRPDALTLNVVTENRSFRKNDCPLKVIFLVML
jgi:hypothetical protein